MNKAIDTPMKKIQCLIKTAREVVHKSDHDHGFKTHVSEKI